MKTKIKRRYLEKLPAAYPGLYPEGGRAITMAGTAADNALAGRMKLAGECWETAVQEVTGWSKWTMRALADLPE